MSKPLEPPTHSQPSVEKLPGLWVFAGGALGASARVSLDYLLAGAALVNLQLSTLIVNTLGAFALGWLSAVWMRRRENNPAWDRYKFFFGTGALGAFTTYSTFALLLARGEAFSAWNWVVALAAVAAGMAALIAGWAVGSRR